MSENEGKKCGMKGKLICLVVLLTLIVVGTGIQSSWTAWMRYKKYSAEEYSITIVTQDGSTVAVESGYSAKVFRIYDRVDVFKNDKSERVVYYAPRSVRMQKK